MKTDEDFGIICLCALRYCFGRKTYMPRLVIEFIKKNWQYVSPVHKNLLMTEVRDALDKHDPNNFFYNLGDECDVNTYKCFFDWMKEQS
jgi:hypothetical protein